MDKYIRFEVECETVSPVVSGEIKTDRKNKTKTALARITGDGKVAVPIYGVMRAYLEKTLREAGEDVCDTGTSGGCGKCVLCNLFGSLQSRGRAVIDDLKSEENYREIANESTHIRISRETNTVSQSQTLRMEEIQEGATFRGSIRIIDPKERDKELIVTALKALEEFGLGGWLTRGRGRVTVKYSIEEKKWSDYIAVAKQELQSLKSW